MSKQLALEEMEENFWSSLDDSYEEVMEEYQPVVPVLQDQFEDMNRIDAEIEALQRSKSKVLGQAQKIAFNFHNDNEYPEGLINVMVSRRNSIPFFYVQNAQYGQWRGAPFYEGESNNGKCVVNPFYIDKGYIKKLIRSYNRENE